MTVREGAFAVPLTSERQSVWVDDFLHAGGSDGVAGICLCAPSQGHLSMVIH